MSGEAIPVDEKSERKVATKTITAGDINGGGKLKPAQGKFRSGIRKPLTGQDDEEEEVETIKNQFFVPISKTHEERTVMGVVLQPEITDAQGDIYDAKVIRKAAHNFLAAFNKKTKLGLMHDKFNKRFELVESSLMPMDFVLNNRLVVSGSWIMVVRVLDNAIWKDIKEGKITGFSIGGKAKVKKLPQKAA